MVTASAPFVYTHHTKRAVIIKLKPVLVAVVACHGPLGVAKILCEHKTVSIFERSYLRSVKCQNYRGGKERTPHGIVVSKEITVILSPYKLYSSALYVGFCTCIKSISAFLPIAHMPVNNLGRGDHRHAPERDIPNLQSIRTCQTVADLPAVLFQQGVLLAKVFHDISVLQTAFTDTCRCGSLAQSCPFGCCQLQLCQIYHCPERLLFLMVCKSWSNTKMGCIFTGRLFHGSSDICHGYIFFCRCKTQLFFDFGCMQCDRLGNMRQTQRYIRLHTRVSLNRKYFLCLHIYNGSGCGVGDKIVFFCLITAMLAAYLFCFFA